MAAERPVETKRNYSVAVVGGGIGGLMTVIGLRRQGVQVEVYEAAHAFAEIGAGVSIGPNAERAMEMVDPAIKDGYKKIRTMNGWPDHHQDWFSFHIADGTTLPSTSTPKNPEKFGEPFFNLHSPIGQCSVHRAHLLDVLVELVPRDIAHFGKRLDSVEDTPEGVVLHFADGSSATHDAVIGCDGIKSATRRCLFGVKSGGKSEQDDLALPTYTGKYAYRGLIPMEIAAASIGDELARNAQMYLGTGRHILTFPIEQGKTMNVVAFATSKSGTWDHKETTIPFNHHTMLEDFKRFAKPVQKILDLLEHSDIWALFEQKPLPKYWQGRTCLLGDSAHGSTPHNGNGAAQAMEDALCMSTVLGQVYDSADLEAAFEAFDQVRRPRSQQQVKEARKMGEVYELQDAESNSSLETLAKRLSESKPWLWEHDLEAEQHEVKRLFKKLKNVE